MDEKIQRFSPVVDHFSRTISYLRLSVTDKCNLRCRYCMPQVSEKDLVASREFLPHHQLLHYEELLRVVRCAVALGLSKLRLTGGEPLLRNDIVDFVEQLTTIAGLEQIRLTTNGVLLERYANQLYQLGIRHLNISLDTLSREKFTRITGRDLFSKVWQALNTVIEMGFQVKLNVVAMKGINDDEFCSFADFALNNPVQVRFIEFMPTGDAGSWHYRRFVAVENIRQLIEPLGKMTLQAPESSAGPARIYTLETKTGKRGRVGFISPLSHHFCESCNRLRLTAEGRLRACLLHDTETDLKALLRGGGSDEQIMAAIREAIINKPKGHGLQSAEDVVLQSRYDGKMSRIGG